MTKVRFAHPLVIRSRTVESTQQDPGYEAEVMTFPWVGVWQRGDKASMRITTVFNIVDRDPGDDVAPLETVAKMVKR